MGVLDGKVAMVTGAGRLRGIGRATAVILAAAGADVVVTGTGRDPATFPADEKAVNWNDVHSTVEQIEAQGQRGLALLGDISQQADVSRMVQQTLDTFGRVDILVNNAAIARGADRVPVVELSEELFRRVLDVKVVGAFLLCKAIIPTLLQQNQGGELLTCPLCSASVARRAPPPTARRILPYKGSRRPWPWSWHRTALASTPSVLAPSTRPVWMSWAVKSCGRVLCSPFPCNVLPRMRRWLDSLPTCVPPWRSILLASPSTSMVVW